MDDRSRTERDGRPSYYKMPRERSSTPVPGVLILVATIALLGTSISLYVQTAIQRRVVAEHTQSIEKLKTIALDMQNQIAAWEEERGAIAEEQLRISKAISSLKESLGKLESRDQVKISLSSEQKKEIQIMLTDLGYYRKSIDGSAGPATQAAIRQFQAIEGDIPVNGNINDMEFQERLKKRFRERREGSR